MAGRVIALLTAAPFALAACGGAAVTATGHGTDGATTHAPLEICINELMPDNAASVADESGAMPDWIELHNPGATRVDLTGWSLTDDERAPGASVLPAGLELPPGGFLVLWADHLPALGPRHLAFQLDDAGGVVGLFAPDRRGSLVKYDAIAADFSAARRPDCCTGDGCFAFDFRGSPGRTNVDHPLETVPLLAARSTWRYLDNGAAPAAGWTGAAFDDSAWKRGAAPLGYGDAHIASTVSYGPDANRRYITTWFRTRFTVSGAGALVAARISLLRDDGAVVYLNGAEVARSNLPAGALGPATLASGGVTGADETAYSDTALDPKLLVEGMNVLAVEVHQSGPTSGDLGMDCTVSADRPML